MIYRQLVALLVSSLQGRKLKAFPIAAVEVAQVPIEQKLMDVELSVPCKGETSKEPVIEGRNSQSKPHLDASHWPLLLCASENSLGASGIVVASLLLMCGFLVSMGALTSPSSTVSNQGCAQHTR